jgi:hypothetical protein
MLFKQTINLNMFMPAQGINIDGERCVKPKFEFKRGLNPCLNMALPVSKRKDRFGGRTYASRNGKFRPEPVCL